jgi:hypothetical protein
MRFVALLWELLECYPPTRTFDESSPWFVTFSSATRYPKRLEVAEAVHN